MSNVVMTYRSYRDFLRTTRLLGVFPGVPMSLDLFFRFTVGVAYGGGRLDLAASQSNGCDAEREGEVTGEIGYTSRVLGVFGRTGVEGDAAVDALNAPPALGDAFAAALVCARRRSEDMVLGRQRLSETRDTEDANAPVARNARA